MDKLTLDQLSKENIALRGSNLITLSVKNDKNEELVLHEVFENITKYIDENIEKINNGISLIASYAVGPFTENQRPFILGYLYCKYIEKLQEKEKTKYNISYVERSITKQEWRDLLADFLEKNIEMSRDWAKKLREGKINEDELGF